MTTFVNLAALLALLTVHNVNVKAQVDAATRSGMPGMGQPLPLMGSNAGGGSVFDNYDKLVEEGQFFLLWEAINQKEEPDQEVLEFTMVYWCADFNYPKVDETDPVIGYTGACVEHFLRGDSYSGEHVTDGKNHTLTAEEATSAYMLASVYVSQSNLIEGQMHESTDNWVKRFWDNGMESMPGLGWETHDEGDTAPNAYKSNWSGVGKFSWISVEEAADLLGKEKTSFTPDAFIATYKNVWRSSHGDEVASVSGEGGEPEEMSPDD